MSPLTAFLSRRAFLNRVAAIIVGGVGMSAIGVRPALAGDVYVAPGQKVTCSATSSCHRDPIPPSECSSGCCYPIDVCDVWFVFVNFYTTTKWCDGTTNGPCGEHGYGKQCYGSPKSWMTHSFNKCCCGG